MTFPHRPNLARPRARVATVFLAALLLALAGCGGTDDSDPRPSFEPITCSAQPSPCA